MTHISHGMDLAEVEDLGRFMQQRADRLRRIVQEINRAVYAVQWQGGVAVQFGQQQWPRHRARLGAAADGLHGLGQSALNNASEQRGASQMRHHGGVALVGGGVFRLAGNPWTILDGSLNLAAGLVEEVVEGSVRVGGGAWKSGYGWIWNEHAGQGVRASFAHGVLKPIMRAGSVALAVVDGWGTMEVQRIRDGADPTLDEGEVAARQAGAFIAGAGASGAVSIGARLATGAAAGAVVGTLVPVPIVGTAVGAVVGLGVTYAGSVLLESSVGSMTVREHIGEAGADLFDAGLDAYRAVDASLDALPRAAADLWSNADGLTTMAVDRLWPF